MEKEIKGYKGLYTVKPNGDIISYVRVSSGKKLKPQKHTHGYRYVTLVKGGEKKNHLIHRLVGEAFIPNPENKRTINHKDGDKTNNHVDNLEWATYSENNQHGIDSGLIGRADLKGSKNSQSKLTENDVRKIHDMLKDGLSYGEIADMYNVTNELIGMINRGQAWTHVEVN